MEIIISLSILFGGWALVFYWDKKADKEKKRKYPSTTRRLDEFEEKIS